MWPGKLKIIEHQAQEILSGMLSLDGSEILRDGHFGTGLRVMLSRCSAL